jgi:hypothetical protein
VDLFGGNPGPDEALSQPIVERRTVCLAPARCVTM